MRHILLAITIFLTLLLKFPAVLLLIVCLQLTETSSQCIRSKCVIRSCMRNENRSTSAQALLKVETGDDDLPTGQLSFRGRTEQSKYTEFIIKTCRQRGDKKSVVVRWAFNKTYTLGVQPGVASQRVTLQGYSWSASRFLKLKDAFFCATQFESQSNPGQYIESDDQGNVLMSRSRGHGTWLMLEDCTS